MTKRPPNKSSKAVVPQAQTPAPTTAPAAAASTTLGIMEKRKLAAERRALERFRTRAERPEVTFSPAGEMAPDISQETMHCDVLGTSSQSFAAVAMDQLASTALRRGLQAADHTRDAEVRTEASLAIVAAVEAENELEAALAVQLAATHTLAMEMITRARHTDRNDHIALYTSLGVKLLRTSVAQIEALTKLRTAGKQVVEVKHVHTYVGPGGQAIVGDVSYGGPGGGDQLIGGQPHAPADFAVDGSAALPCQDPQRQALPIPASDRPEALPDARRRQRRRPEGAGQR